MKQNQESEKSETQGKHYVVDTRIVSPLNRAGGNIRTDYGEKDGSLQELVDSIRENGIKEPIKGFRDPEDPERWIAVNGHTRLKACEILNKEGKVIRAKIITIDSRSVSDEDLIFDMISSNAGRPLKPMEMAEAVRRLLNYGLEIGEIAKRFGKELVFVKNLELLSKAPKKFREMVSDGSIAYTLVLQTFKKTQDWNKAVEIIEKAGGVAKSEKIERIKKSDSDSDINPDTVQQKITKRHVDEAMNRVDSIKELQRALNNFKESEEDKEIKNQELFKFANDLANGRLVSSDIEELLFS